VKLALRKAMWKKLAARSRGQSKFRGATQAVIPPRPAANHSVCIQRVCESQAWCPVVAVHAHVAMISPGKNGRAKEVRIGREYSGSVDRHGNGAGARQRGEHDAGGGS